jgi:drug/metabolite transporter (DMT)-like permease
MGVLGHAVKMPFWVLAFARSLVIAGMIAPVLLAQKLPFLGKGSGWLYVRSLAGSQSLFCYFFALQEISLSDATLLTYSNPVWIALLAPFLLREKSSLPRVLAVLTGLSGLVLVLGPSGRWLEPGGLAGLSSGLGSAIAYMAVRKLRDDHPATVVFHFAVTSLVLAIPGVLLAGRLPIGAEWLAVLAIGITAGLGQYLMTAGYRHVEASAGSIMSLLTPALAQFASALLFEEPFSLPQLLGGILVIGSGVALSLVESRKRRQTTEPSHASEPRP